MREISFSDIYTLGKYKNLLIYRKVVGIYIKEEPEKIPEGYYYQHINYHGKDYRFLYREFSLGTLGFALTLRSLRKKVTEKFEGLLVEIEKETGYRGENPEELEFFTNPLPDYVFAGLSEKVPEENFAVIARGKKRLVFTMNRGIPLPKRSYELVFHPLFFFPSEDFPDFLENIKKKHCCYQR